MRFGDRNLEAVWIGPKPHEAPTLVLLHEGLGSVSAWRDWPAELAEKSGFGVLVYSRFGYGASDPSPLPWPTTYMHREADDVVPEVLRQAKIERCVLVGHSDGASISILHAGGVHASPLVHGLVLMSPHVFVEPISVEAIERSKEVYAKTDLREKLGKHHKDVDHAFRGWNDIWLHTDFRAWNIESFVPKVRVPMLLVQEENDPYGTLAQIDAIERGAKASTKRLILPGNGHAPWKELREETTRATIDFARSVFAH